MATRRVDHTLPLFDRSEDNFIDKNIWNFGVIWYKHEEIS